MQSKLTLTFLLILLFSLSAYAQVTIRGTVTSAEDQQPLPGVSVTVKGTTRGTVTDIDGNYAIDVQPDDILVFTYVGFVPQERKIDGQNTINVVLQTDTYLMEEVVVMGYSSKTKNEIGSAVSVVSAEKLNDVISPTIGDMLQGKVAGVSVIKSSGAPGAEPSIRIRGLSSMNAPQDPLFVVDGIIGGSYDPNDVESVTVLKDAGATGMYGAQANGGVIIVTTKSAKASKPVYNFKASVGITQADFSRQERMNSEQLYHYYREYFRDPETFLIDDVQYNKVLPRSVTETNTDWRGLVFDPGVVQNYHLSLMGKTEKNTYYSSITFYDEKGTLKNTGYKRLNLRSNNTFNLTDWLTLTSNINLSANTRNSMDGLILYYLGNSLPFDSPYDSEGNLRKFADATDIWARDKVNPLLAFENEQLSNKTKGFGVDYDLVLNVRIKPWLTFNSQNRINGSTEKYHFHRTVDIEYMQSGDFLEEEQSLNYGGISTNMFKADYSFGKHSLSGLAGYEAQRSWGENIYGSGQGLPYGLYVLDVTSATPQVGGHNYQTGMQSLITQANYNFNSRYFLTASYRIDQSSTFNKDNRTASFPSLSGSWVVSNEEFLKDYSTINNLKLKASWGKTGMKDIGASKYLDAFSYSTQYNNNTSAVPTQMANPDLKWEQTTQMNTGFEIGLFNRISLDFNYYYNNTDDLLVYRDLPPSGGFSSQWQNLGSVVNTGFEAALSATPIKNQEITWNVDFSIAYNRNWLYGFGDTEIYSSSYSGLTQVYKDKFELYTWYIKEYAGIDPATGREQFYDKDGNLTYDYASARYVTPGSALIPWEGGFATYLTYKNFKLSATGNYVWGNLLYGRKRASTLATFLSNSLLPSNEDVIWRKPGDIATIGIPAYASAEIYHTGDLVRGDYLKLRDVTLSYTFPKKVMPDYGLTLSLSCDNVFTATKVWGADPEVSISTDDGVAGRIQDLDYRYPNKRQYAFQVNFTF